MKTQKEQSERQKKSPKNLVLQKLRKETDSRITQLLWECW